MLLEGTPIAGLKMVTTTSKIDDRGAFARLFCRNALTKVMNGRCIKQINYSKTNEAGTVRGLHFQYPPYAEMKLIHCIRGAVWDVAVDLRKDSPTYLNWHAINLTSENQRMVIIPEGVAHGFQSLAPNSELIYLHTAYYMPEFECGIKFDDPILNIPWPLSPKNISERDISLHYFDPKMHGVIL